MRSSALVGGLVFLAFSGTQGHIFAGHINPLANYALPLVVLCLFRILEGRDARRFAIIGAVAILILLTGNYTAAVYGLLPFMLFGGLYALIWRRTALRAAARYLLLMFGLGALFLIPFYAPLVAESLAANRPAYLDEGGAIRYSTELLAFAAPSPFTAWLKPIVPSFTGDVIGTNIIEGFAYIGVLTTLLALVALWRRRSQAGLWLAIALGCMMFSLGPVFKWHAQPVQYTLDSVTITVPLPWALLQNLPLINVTRTPGRFNMTTGLPLGVLVAIGLTVILRRVPKGKWLIALSVGAAMLGEYQVMTPFPITPAAVAPYFATLADRKDIHAVFDVPWDDLGAQKGALGEQMIHHQALLAGFVTRRTTVDPVHLTLLSKIATGEGVNANGVSLSQDADAVRAILKQNGVDVVVYHWRTLNRDSVLPWATSMFGAPAYQDDSQAIFEIPAASKPFAETAVVYGDGWWSDTARQPWTTGDSTLLVYAPARSDQQWHFAMTPLLSARKLQLYVDGGLVSGASLAKEGGEVILWPQLDAGFHTLHLVFPDGCVPTPVPPICLTFNNPARLANSCEALPAPICVSAALNHLSADAVGDMVYQPRVVHLHDTNTAAAIDLRGFRAPATAAIGGSFSVVTEWAAAHPIYADYHLFVHLLSKTGALASQADGVPGGGTFPTTAWHASQTWIEALQLSVPADAPPGVYSLFAGWYRYPDMTRLGVDGDSPHAQDGEVYLGDVQIQ